MDCALGLDWDKATIGSYVCVSLIAGLAGRVLTNKFYRPDLLTSLTAVDSIYYLPRTVQVVKHCQRTRNLWRGAAVHIICNDEFCAYYMRSTAAEIRYEIVSRSENYLCRLQVRRSSGFTVVREKANAMTARDIIVVCMFDSQNY